MTYVIIGTAAAMVVIGAVFYLLYRRRRVPQAEVPEQVAEAEAGETAEVTSAAPVVPEGMTPETGEDTSQVVSDTSSLPESDKWNLMNAVWYRCENPYCNYTQFLDVHHIVSEVDGGTHALSNLIVLCPRCHAAVHSHEVSQAVLRVWVQKRAEFKFELNWPYK
ncbi:MAG: hypothetical protein HW402_1158 [Dehalococcoidales bacterium]|nr:hypothetical protein [Dehalococcoidales bacterium]